MVLSIVIINYKTPGLVVRCLESLFETPPLNSYEIIIIDNASQDNSIEIITEHFPSVKWVQNENNEGFGRANNLGISNSAGE